MSLRRLLGLVLTVLIATSAPAVAAFPGANGRIVFQTNRDGNAEIYIMNADGTGQTNLTNNPSEDLTPAWSADGSKIAFSSNRDGNSEIYVMNADGTDVTRITNSGATDLFPAWSPDGLKIAFASFTDNYDIWTINVDGTGAINLTNHPTEDVEPAWSPDGSKIAFRTLRGVDFFDTEIYVMNAADGSELTNLTNDPAPDGDADWAPDGSQILFSSFRFGFGAVWVMQSDGSGQTALTAIPNGDGMPAWSPDGSKIVFTSFRDFNQEIYVMNADGTDPVRLTNNAPPGQTIPEDFFADWQPVPSSTVESEIDQLIQDVSNLNLPVGLETSLMAHLSTVRARIVDTVTSNDVASIRVLEAFVNQLRGVPVLVDKNGQVIPEASREQLIEAAESLVERLSV